MSKFMIRPALQPYQRRTARKVRRASSTPDRTSRLTPVSSRTRASTASEFVASRTADVANAISSPHPEVAAIDAKSPTAATSRSAPTTVMSPRSSVFSASRRVDFVELIGVGCAPLCASTTRRWTVLLPTSSTPNRT